MSNAASGSLQRLLFAVAEGIIECTRLGDATATPRGQLRASCAVLCTKLDVFCYSYSALDVAIPALFMRPLCATSSRRQVALELTLATLFCLMPLA